MNEQGKLVIVGLSLALIVTTVFATTKGCGSNPEPQRVESKSFSESDISNVKRLDRVIERSDSVLKPKLENF